MSNDARSLTLLVLCIGIVMACSYKFNAAYEYKNTSYSTFIETVPVAGHTLPDLSQFTLGNQCPRILQVPAAKLSIEFNDYAPKEKRADQIIRLLKGKATKADNTTATAWGIFYETAAPDRANLDYVILYEDNGILKEISTKELSKLIGHDVQEWEVNTIRKNRIC